MWYCDIGGGGGDGGGGGGGDGGERKGGLHKRNQSFFDETYSRISLFNLHFWLWNGVPIGGIFYFIFNTEIAQVVEILRFIPCLIIKPEIFSSSCTLRSRICLLLDQ